MVVSSHECDHILAPNDHDHGDNDDVHELRLSESFLVVLLISDRL